MNSRTLKLACGLLFVLVCESGYGQPFPSKPLRIITGVTAGGTSDTIGRMVGQKMSESWGQQVVIDNRPGAGGLLAAELCVKSPPDGYTALLVNPGLAINAAGRTKISYNAMTDLAPVAQLTISPYVLVVNPSLPVRTVKDLIALAKAKPGQINFASAGVGNADHLTGELFKMMAKVNIIHVPYKSATLAVSEIAGGQVEMIIVGLAVALPLARSGRLRALAVTTVTRSRIASDLPTMAEAGLPGYEQILWGGVFVPARTPKDVITRLNSEFVKALDAPGIREQLAAIGAEPQGSTPEQLGALLKREIDTFGKVMREIGLALDR